MYIYIYILYIYIYMPHFNILQNQLPNDRNGLNYSVNESDSNN